MTVEPWIGYRNGDVVVEYSDRWAANAALERYEVDMVAPGTMNLADLVAAAKAANERWDRAVLTGRRNSAEYKAAFTAKLAANRAMLAARLDDNR